MPKTAQKFLCISCDFETSKQCNYVSHILTLKHKILTNPNIKTAEKMFECLCGKKYKHRSSLSSHKKKFMCIEKKETIVLVKDNDSDFDKNIVLSLLNENIELQKQIIQLYKDKPNTTINNTTTNNFNLQIFLNEKCKDALNIMEFVSSLKLKLTDLESIGKLGYSEGISKIFIRGLKELDIFKRPIHCSDVKRDTLYIKDKDSWEKDNENKEKMKLAIDYIANENIKLLPVWISENPQANDYESTKHLEYIKILGESVGGSYETEIIQKNYNKIIKNVAKEVVIDKI
jgi:hypothetical protein